MTWWKLVAFAFATTWVSFVLAQPAAELRPPIVEGSTDVPYPTGAHGGGVVVLELVVEKDGRISSVEIIEGEAPFAEHARQAVRAWKVKPGERAGVAVAARIRARIEFREPVEEATPPPEVPVESTARAPTKTPDAPVEVSVQGERRELGHTTLSAAEVREMPGAFGDPFRAVEALPGVTPALSGLPYFFVRGSPPNNSGFFVDGVRVPVLFHVALGPGVIHPALLERIDFYPGAAPARFGGFAGAIVAGKTREPATRAHGEVSLRLVDSSALVESPFADGRGTALIAGRYGYPGPIISAFSEITLAYWDYQARATWQLGAHDTIGVFAFGSHDYLAHRDEQSGDTVEDLVSDFHRVDLRHVHSWKRGHVRTSATLGYDSHGSDPTYLTDRSAAVRLDVEEALDPTLRLRTGAEARVEDYGFREGAPVDPDGAVVPSSANPPPTNLTQATHVDVVWQMAPRVEVVPGVRFAIFDSARARSTTDTTRTRTTVPAVEPRLATRLALTDRVAWLSNLGLSHQFPVLRVGALPALVANGAGFPPGNAQLQRTLHHSQGLEVGLPWDLVVTLTGFGSYFSGLTDLTASCLQLEPPSAPVGPPGPTPYFCPSNRPVSGHAHGIELMVRRSLSKRLGGWISYTLSRSVRDAHFLTLEGGERTASVPSEFDRTHVLNAVVGYDLGRRWRIGTRFVAYSGSPHSKLAGSVPVPPYNSERDPPFFRTDLRLEKRWRLGKDGFFAFVFEVLNATLSKEANTLGQDCEGNTDGTTQTTQCERGMVGPITIPSVGVEAVF